jgi:ribosomal subunit interface protein
MDPVQISYHGLESSPALSAIIETRAAQLARLNERILSLRVVVEAPPHHHRHGSRHRVRIELAIPHTEHVVVGHGIHEDPYQAVRRAFDVARRQLLAAQERMAPRMHSADAWPVSK